MEISIFHLKHWFFSYRNTYGPCLPVFLCLKHFFVSTCVRLFFVFFVLFFCVDVCPSTADEEMKVTDHEMCSKKDLSLFPRQTIQ